MTKTADAHRMRGHPDVANAPTAPVFLNMRQLRELTGLGEMTLRRMIEREQFPRPVRLSAQRVAWRVGDVRTWVASRVEVG